MKQFEEQDAVLLGMSVDSMFALKTWAIAMGGIRHALLADFWPHGGVAKTFGLLNEDAGIINRALVIIDPDGVIRHSELHARTLPQVDDALAALARLKG